MERTSTKICVCPYCGAHLDPNRIDEHDYRCPNPGCNAFVREFPRKDLPEDNSDLESSEMN